MLSPATKHETTSVFPNLLKFRKHYLLIKMKNLQMQILKNNPTLNIAQHVNLWKFQSEAKIFFLF